MKNVIKVFGIIIIIVLSLYFIINTHVADFDTDSNVDIEDVKSSPINTELKSDKDASVHTEIFHAAQAPRNAKNRTGKKVDRAQSTFLKKTSENSIENLEPSTPPKLIEPAAENPISAENLSPKLVESSSEIPPEEAKPDPENSAAENFSDDEQVSRVPSHNVKKPYGIYASSNKGMLTNKILSHPELKGVLVHVNWKDVEPSKGNYNFSSIRNSVNSIESEGKMWSLAVNGGKASPSWFGDIGIESSSLKFRGKDVIIPKFWDPLLQERITLLANALADEFGSDTSLRLVYVTQMSINGIEGHFNGISKRSLLDTGYSVEKWITASTQASKAFAKAFHNKAIAIELHEILGDVTPAKRIMYDLWNDPGLNNRIGVGMWWISGKTTYQPKLLNVLKEFPGDIYAQAIGRSDQVERFLDDNYALMFKQAEELNVRSLEIWPYEFKNGRHDASMSEFNSWAEKIF